MTSPLPRPVVPALETILGMPFTVLDDGFVRVVDYMGDDNAIVQAARVSYGTGTKKLSDDRALIRYLMRHAHTTPFEMCEVKLHVRVPMDCWRQWIRHRTASVNEYSTRYSEAIDAAQRTDPAAWRMQSTTNRQGGETTLDPGVGQALSETEALLQQKARAVYEERLRQGVAREQARKDLPLSTYTEAYWKIDLHNLFHFLNLRMDDHAQQEIRSYATTIGHEIVAKWCPIAWESFLDYRFNALRLSRMDVSLINAIAKKDATKAKTLAMQYGFLTEEGLPRQSRERCEFEEKIRTMGLQAPWYEKSLNRS
ncbi:FAD-dependent thymidylate synthase [Candidatus Peregrinibacteria bacterium]|nr:FAD-dependent thymidylate synthase [Candidatus Peregrinibacteria bacterium]